MMRADLAEKAFHFTQENSLIRAGSSVVVGVSGGADSMALLHLLTHAPFEDLRVYAVHVHHGLRGEEADRDAEFVADYCAKNGIQLHTVRADVRGLSQETHVGLEEAGRRARYDAFERIRKQIGAACVATAHTASDCAETMLMHLIRGSGAGGLTGIPSKRGHIIRPLLCCTREEVETYCAEYGVGYIVDSTNVDISYTRNRVRCQLMPLLKQINPAVESALMRLRDAVAQDEAYLQSIAADELAKARRQDGGYDSAVFLRLPQSVRVRMWKSLLVEIGCFSYTEKHIFALDHALEMNRGTVFLPNGHRVVISADCVKAFASSEPLCEDFCFSVDTLPMRFVIAGHEHVLQSVSQDEMNRLQNVHKLFFKYAVDCDKIQGGLCVRRRADGDAFHPAGRRVGKSLKKIFQEHKIPIYQREIYPLLCDDVGVVLMPGVGCDARVCPDDSTKHFLVWLTDGEPSYTVNCLWDDKSVDGPATDFKER